MITVRSLPLITTPFGFNLQLCLVLKNYLFIYPSGLLFSLIFMLKRMPYAYAVSTRSGILVLSVL